MAAAAATAAVVMVVAVAGRKVGKANPNKSLV
jgi:hypothetical protein